jgi:ABC-type polysaccharide/polyol phosphate export permease
MHRLDRSPLAQLTLAWLRETAREPEAVFWTFVFPILLALALGVAFRRSTPEQIPIAIASAAGAERAAAALNGAGGMRAAVMQVDSAAVELRRGNVALVVVPRGEEFEFRFDPTRADSRGARVAVNDALQRAAGRADPRATHDVIIEERGSRYIDFLIPGLLGLNLLSTGLWGVGYMVVRMRKDRLLKRLQASSVPRGRFLLGFMLGRLVFLAVELPLLLGFAWLVFGVPVRGSIVLLTALAVLGAFTFTGFGLLIASRARTTEAVTGLMNLASLPMWILSGVFFSADNFPAVMQPFIQALPLTGLVEAMRGVMLDGSTLAGVGSEVALVAAWGLASLLIAVRIFRWQ